MSRADLCGGSPRGPPQPVPDLRAPAGKPSVYRGHGGSSLSHEHEWGLTPPEGSRGAWVPGGDGAESETKATFKPKVSQTTRAARPHNSSRELTAGVYPVDFRTTKQTEFDENVVRGASPPPTMFRTEDCGQIFFDNIPPREVFRSSNSDFYGGKSPTTVKAAHEKIAGNSNTKKGTYNIITGGSLLVNNTFESWEGKHDYRRRIRP